MLQHLKQDIDRGTPASPATATVSLQIDGFTVTVPQGTSLMRAATEAGIRVPKLCATDSLEPFGSCRLCLVEIDGRKGYPSSCTTPAETGMVVRTQTPKLQTLRKGVMELYISDHPLDCLTCSANGNCELQDMAGVTGLRNVRYGVGAAAGHHHTDAKKDESNPYFSYDPSKCIVCSRCVRACEETQGTFALTISGRGFDSRVSPGQDATIRFSSFNSSVPTIFGRVLSVSADAMADQATGMPFYLARVAVTEEGMQDLGNLTLVPGMPAEVFINSGSRTFLQYVMKPFSNAIARSLRED